MSLVLEDFGSDVVGSPADGFFPFAVVFESGSETKIPEFYFHVVIEEKVSEFEAGLG